MARHSAAERSHPTSEVRGCDERSYLATEVWVGGVRGVTPYPKSGAAMLGATSRPRSGPETRGATPRPRSGALRRGATWLPSSGSAAELCYYVSEVR